MRTVGEMCGRDVIVAAPETTVAAAAKLMRHHHVGCVVIVDKMNGGLGIPRGIVTDRDIVVRVVAEGGQLNGPVRDIVTSALVSATPEMSTREAAELMSEHQIRRLPVVENDRLVGIVSIGDLAVKEGKDGRIGDTLQHISEGVKERE